MLEWDEEPGFTIMRYGLYASAIGFGVGMVGVVLFTTGVIGTSVTLNHLGVDVPYTGLWLGAAGVVGIVGFAVAGTQTQPDTLADTLVDWGLLASILTTTTGAAMQFVTSNQAYREHTSLTVALRPAIGVRSQGLALVGTF